MNIGKFVDFKIPKEVRQLLFSLGIALVVAFAVVSLMAPSKGNYKDDVARIEGELVAVQQADQNQTTKLNQVRAEMASSFSSRDSVIATIHTQMAELDGKVASINPENYATTGSVTALEAMLKGGVDSLKKLVNKLRNEVDDLTYTFGATTNVAVTIVDGVPLILNTTPSAITPGTFTLRLTNGTRENRYITYGISLVCTTGDATVNNYGLTALGDYAVTFSTVLTPDSSKTTQILFTATTRVDLPPGKSIDIKHKIDVRTVENEQWECRLTGVSASW